MPNRALIIDADIFLYQAVTDALEEARTADDEYIYRLNAKSVQQTLKTRIKSDMVALKAKTVLLCFGSQQNWRKKILPEYKAHRTLKKPLGYFATMAWCMETWPSLRVSPLEADDIVGIVATDDGYFSDAEKIIVSEDKDLLCVPGLHFDPRKPDDGVFEVTRDQADYNHMKQTLCGDQADGYKGCPGVGPVKAQEILMTAKLDMWHGVVKAFEDAGLTEDDALVQARIAYILRRENVRGPVKEGAIIDLWKPQVAKPLPRRGDAGGSSKRPAVVRRLAKSVR